MVSLSGAVQASADREVVTASDGGVTPLPTRAERGGDPEGSGSGNRPAVLTLCNGESSVKGDVAQGLGIEGIEQMY